MASTQQAAALPRALAQAGAQRRRRVLGIAAAVAAYLLAVPGVRAALRRFLRRFFSKLGRVGQPPVQKDFLSGFQQRRALAGGDAASVEQSATWNGGYAERLSTLGGDVERFADYGDVLPQWLGEGLFRCGFDAMKPIQRKVLPIALAGRDVVGVAPTGSGKTLAFLVPGIVHAAAQAPLRGASDGPIMLVLAPTRELAVQIGTVAEELLAASRGRGGANLQSAVLYGGPRRTDQLQTLRFQKTTHVVVATPGRMLDFLEHGAFKLNRVSFFVLDEGDRMLDFGFEPDVTRISNEIHPQRQLLFFSATWPPEVEEAAIKLCGNGKVPERVYAQPDRRDDGTDRDATTTGESGLGGLTMPPAEIEQVIEILPSGWNEWSYGCSMDRKTPLLLKHLEEALGGEIGETPGKALIFVGTRRAAEELGFTVARHFGLERCGVMHGLRKQDQREATLRAFRDGRLRALVATDVIGRGVDVPDISHVIVYDFPSDIETYVHRVGRTGRNGRPGKSIAFFEPQPWYPDMADELVNVLKACKQQVPSELAALSTVMNPQPWDSWTKVPASPGDQAAWPSPPSQGAPLDPDGGPALADASELGDWHADGARVWSYSANGGESEQGKLELRTKGRLRTTWGWGEWRLMDAPAVGPPCPPPSRACPPATGQVPHCPPPARACPAATAPLAAGTTGSALSAELPARKALALTWNGVTDIVVLDASGMNFDLASRNGRPSQTYKKMTIGRALPGFVL